MNDHYVSIKVDREERPDVDAIYMTAVQALTGSGGWPMSVWLTPDREPFFGGTYFPPRDGARGARHGFLTVLRDVREAYTSDPERVGRATAALVNAVRTRMEATPAAAPAGRSFHVGVADPRHDHGVQAPVRRPRRRRAPRAQVPVEHADPRAAARPRPRRRRRGAADGGADAGEDGGRRHVRPARRRLPPLFDGRALAGAALREDALRQRAARSSPTPRPTRSRGARTSPASRATRSTICCAR